MRPPTTEEYCALIRLLATEYQKLVIEKASDLISAEQYESSKRKLIWKLDSIELAWVEEVEAK